MPYIVHTFDWPDRVVVGTIGRPGSRAFYLQARDGSRVTSVGLEKMQSAALAEKIDEILEQVMAADGNPVSVPTGIPVELVDNEPLDQPVEPEFRAGALSLGWDPSTAQVVIEAFPLVEVADGADVDEAELEPDEVLVVRIPVGTARAFAARTLEIVGAGRPLCPFCGQPIDPEGHLCVLSGDL